MTNFSDSVTAAYDASTGVRLWLQRYNGSGNAMDEGLAVTVSPDGSAVFVTGSSAGSTSDDYVTLAYEASTGAPLWSKRYNGPAGGDDLANSLGVSADGTKVFVTGWSFTSTTNASDYATVAYDASTGAKLWVGRYNGPGNGYDHALALGVSPDGAAVFVTGSSPGSTGNQDYATAAFDASTGAPLWVARYDDPGHGDDIGHDVAVSPDSSALYVTGASHGMSGGKDYATIAYDAVTGAPQWVRRYTGTGGSDVATSAEVSRDGSALFITGGSVGATSGTDYATVAYDTAIGSVLWTRRYDGPGNAFDRAAWVAVSSDTSDVFITGRSVGSTSGQDIATVGYDGSTGGTLWARRYNGPANSFDIGYAVASSPDGSQLFVAGTSVGSTSSWDFVTLAYSLH
jgi:TolB-like protein